MRKVLVIILFLLSLSPAFSSENQKTELNKLFSELKKINNSLGLLYNNELIAFLLGDLISVEKKSEYEILLVYVHKKFRKLGYATLLINEIIKPTKEYKIESIYLEVAENNLFAINLYKKNNFIKVGMRKKYYSIENRKINAILFNKRLNDK